MRVIERYPGLKVRIAQAAVADLSRHLLDYGVSLFNFNPGFISDGAIGYQVLPRFDFYNVHHSDMKIDLSTFNFEFTSMKINHVD
jgi:hypothetical protein